MKRLYNRLIMLLLAAVMLVSLAACAGQDTPQPNGSESAQPSSDVAEPSQDALASSSSSATGGPLRNTKKRNRRPHGIRWSRTITTSWKRR